MTFSNAEVRALLNKDFVCARLNTEGDANAGGSLAHAPGEPAGTCIRGNGEHNIQMLVLAPDGRMLSVIAGYIDARSLLEELRLAQKAFAALAETDRRPERDRVAEIHRDFLTVLAKREFAGRLGDWERRRALQDHRFAVRHALLPAAEYRPEMLVGNGKTFFSTSRGRKPKETIGDTEARDLLDRLRDRDGDGDEPDR